MNTEQNERIVNQHDWGPRAWNAPGVRCSKCFQIAWGPHQKTPCEASHAASGGQEEPPRCPKCGYSEEDARLHGDHRLCSGTIPAAPEQAKGDCPPAAATGAEREFAIWLVAEMEVNPDPSNEECAYIAAKARELFAPAAVDVPNVNHNCLTLAQLVAENERLRRDRDEFKEDFIGRGESCARLVAERDAALANLAAMQKAAAELKEHAWLARLRDGDADMSDFAAKEIAWHVDALIDMILEPLASPLPPAEEERP